MLQTTNWGSYIRQQEYLGISYHGHRLGPENAGQTAKTLSAGLPKRHILSELGTHRTGRTLRAGPRSLFTLKRQTEETMQDGTVHCLEPNAGGTQWNSLRALLCLPDRARGSYPLCLTRSPYSSCLTLLTLGRSLYRRSPCSLLLYRSLCLLLSKGIRVYLIFWGYTLCLLLCLLSCSVLSCCQQQAHSFPDLSSRSLESSSPNHQSASCVVEQGGWFHRTCRH